jgi:hypothetical protein
MDEGNWSRLEMNSTTSAIVQPEDEAGSEYLFVLPVIVIVGLVGNFVSLVTILNTRLRKVSIIT